MKGTLYGIGVGPGDSGLVTVKAAEILKRSKHVFVPKARSDGDSVALDIAHCYLSGDVIVKELVFPMSPDAEVLATSWRESAQAVAAVLDTGNDACFLTLGDPLVYSTYIYLVRALREFLSECNVVTIPGVTSFCAVAAIGNFPLGEGKDLITIVPTADDLTAVKRALEAGGTVVLMKIGKRLADILDLLDAAGLIEHSVFVSRAGLNGERVELDLRTLRGSDPEVGYLSVILVHASRKESR